MEQRPGKQQKTDKETCYHDLVTLQLKGVLEEIQKQSPVGVL